MLAGLDKSLFGKILMAPSRNLFYILTMRLLTFIFIHSFIQHLFGTNFVGARNAKVNGINMVPADRDLTVEGKIK